MSDRIQRMEFAEDPERCQGIMAQGQCPNKGLLLDNGKRAQFCLVHGQVQDKTAINESLRNYRLTKFQDRLQRHASSTKIKDLRDEVGILRMMMEEKLNACNDVNDLILQSSAISDLVLKIDKLVSSCHKMEGAMGQLLDKAALLQFASEMITIISEEVQDTGALDRITTKMLERINSNESVRKSDGF